MRLREQTASLAQTMRPLNSGCYCCQDVKPQQPNGNKLDAGS